MVTPGSFTFNYAASFFSVVTILPMGDPMSIYPINHIALPQRF